MVPWLTNLPDSVKAHTLGWLHQWEQDNTGHVYPMRTDWNETMLRWMDHILKGKDTGMDQLWGFEVQAIGPDGEQVWRRTATWPPESEYVLDRTELRFDTETHLTGGAWAEVVATANDPESILSLRLEKSDGTWVSEGVLRAMYRNGLESPAVVAPGEQTTFRVDLYPFDLHLMPGEGLRLVEGEMPTYTVATEPQLATVTYTGITLHLPYAADARLVVPQPTPMECFTC
jgi:predicted acyl esterase